MRFGKRNKSPLLWGRRGKSSEADEFEPVASEERDALLSPGSDAGDANANPSDNGDVEPPMTGDPTQRLLTVLGRFEREMLKGKNGADQGAWSDGAMLQLIHAVQIAVPQGWDDMVEAVTETGRILQSYENAGRANECLAFLSDSYEILCLMAGDLIVDKVRSGVMRKWRERYEVALEDLAAAGLELVQDDEDRMSSAGTAEPSALESPATEAEPEAPFEAPDTPAMEPEAAIEAPTDVSGIEPEPAFEESPVQVEEPVPFEAPPEPQAGASVESDAPSLVAYTEPEGVADAEESLDNDEEPIDEALLDLDLAAEPEPVVPEPAVEVDADADAASGAEAVARYEEDSTTEIVETWPVEDGVPAEQIKEQAPAEDAVDEPDLREETAELLDTLCEGFARIQSQPRVGLETTHEAIRETITVLERHASVAGREGAAQACGVLAELCAPVFERDAEANDRFIELAYAFCGAFSDALEEGGADAAEAWIGECRAYQAEQAAEEEFAEEESGEDKPAGDELQEELMEAAAEDETPPFAVDPEEPEATDAGFAEAPMAEEPVSPDSAPFETAPPSPAHMAEAEENDSGSPQWLLENARNAASSGKAGDAKVLALQAAAHIARIQADKAAQRVEQAEVRLKEGAAAIEAVRDEVRKAEEEVEAAELRVAQARERHEERMNEVAQASESLDAIQSQLLDVEAQLRELEAKRDTLAAGRSEAERKLDEAREDENSARQENGAQQEIERQARVSLEDARQNVKNLQRKRAEIETAMGRARELLTRQRASVEDIERTINEVMNSDSGEGDGADELLF